MENLRIGYAFTGSFCTFDASMGALQQLVEAGCQVTPIFSHNACTIDTRFGRAQDFVAQAENLCRRQAITTILGAEPLGPKDMIDLLVVAPCTSNTLGKIAHGINDTSVTMAVKSHLRSQRPVVLALATNDALAASAENIGILLGRKHFYFVPFGQDNVEKKPFSAIADFSLLQRTVEMALMGRQLQPLLIPSK